jgi:hypothetical protein
MHMSELGPPVPAKNRLTGSGYVRRLRHYCPAKEKLVVFQIPGRGLRTAMVFSMQAVRVKAENDEDGFETDILLTGVWLPEKKEFEMLSVSQYQMIFQNDRFAWGVMEALCNKSLGYRELIDQQ